MDSLFDIIPYEVQQHVLKYLPLTDLKQFGLSCHRFNEISEERLLKISCLKLKNFKFNPNNEIVQVCVKSRRNYSNVLLLNINLIENPSMNFWIRFGVYIKNFYIIDCQMSPTVLISILQHLPNLERWCLDLKIFNDEELEDFEINMDKLQAILVNVKSFKFSFVSLKKSCFSKLMELMPKIEEFTVCEDRMIFESSYLISCYLIPYITEKLEKLKILNIYDLIINQPTLYSISHSKLNLEELNIEMNFDRDVHDYSNIEEDFCKFLQKQKRLKILKISGDCDGQNVPDSFVITMCNHIKSLKELELDSRVVTELRNLETLNLACCYDPIIEGLSKNIHKHRSDKLNKLTLELFVDESNSSCDEFLFISKITKHFMNLTYLSLFIKNANDSVLQIIIQNLIQLQCLQLGNNHQLTDYGITGELNNVVQGVSISQLKGLTNLILSQSVLITEKSFIEIAKCKFVRKISIRCGRGRINFDPENLNKILLNCHSLELLEITNKVTPEDIQILTKDHPRLKFSHKVSY